MGGLLQMAMQVANDPAMQPMISNAMSSLMGAAGGAPGGNGSAGRAYISCVHADTHSRDKSRVRVV
jgi:hypothetical protein